MACWDQMRPHKAYSGGMLGEYTQNPLRWYRGMNSLTVLLFRGILWCSAIDARQIRLHFAPRARWNASGQVRNHSLHHHHLHHHHPWVREQIAYDSYNNRGTQLPAIEATEARAALCKPLPIQTSTQKRCSKEWLHNTELDWIVSVRQKTEQI